jgi:ABC-2 type transport system permease protein
MKESWNRLYHLSLLHFKLILRDKMTIFWFLAFPLIFTVLFGFVVPNVGNQNKIIIVSENVTDQNNSLIDKLSSIPNTEWESNLQPKDAIQQFSNGYLAMVIIIKKDEVHLHYLNERDEKLVLIISDLVERDNSKYTLKLESYNNIHLIEPIDFILPGMIALTIMQIGLFGGTSLLMDRNAQILRRLKTNGVKASEIIMSHIFSRIFLVLLSTVLLIIFGKFILGASVYLSQWYILIPLLLISSFCFLSIGLLIASVFRSPEAGNIFAQAINFPMAFACGVFFPQAILPEFLQNITETLPLTHLVETTRNLFLNIDISGDQMLLTVGILMGWGILCLVIGSKLFKWE